MTLSSSDVLTVARAFADVIQKMTYTCYACAIMPDHIHLLIRKHKHLAEVMIENFQDASRIALIHARARGTDHPVWGGPGWKVFLDSPDEIRRTISYIDSNPAKTRLPRQQWNFVTAYNDWPLHKQSPIR